MIDRVVGLTRDEALSTVRANVGNENLVKHMIACGRA